MRFLARALCTGLDAGALLQIHLVIPTTEALEVPAEDIDVKLRPHLRDHRARGNLVTLAAEQRGKEAAATAFVILAWPQAAGDQAHRDQTRDVF